MSFGNLHSLVIPTVKRLFSKTIIGSSGIDVFEVKTKDGVCEVDFIYYTDDESFINNLEYNNYIIRLFDGRDFCRGKLVKSFKVIKGGGLVNTQPLAPPTGLAFGLRFMSGSHENNEDFNCKKPIDSLKYAFPQDDEDNKLKIKSRILY